MKMVSSRFTLSDLDAAYNQTYQEISQIPLLLPFKPLPPVGLTFQKQHIYRVFQQY